MEIIQWVKENPTLAGVIVAVILALLIKEYAWPKYRKWKQRKEEGLEVPKPLSYSKDTLSYSPPPITASFERDSFQSLLQQQHEALLKERDDFVNKGTELQKRLQGMESEKQQILEEDNTLRKKMEENKRRLQYCEAELKRQ